MTCLKNPSNEDSNVAEPQPKKDGFTTKAQRGRAATEFRNISRKGAKAQRF